MRTYSVTLAVHDTLGRRDYVYDVRFTLPAHSEREACARAAQLFAEIHGAPDYFEVNIVAATEARA